MKIYLSIAIAALFFIACKSGGGSSNLYAEATDFHTESTQLMEDYTANLLELKNELGYLDSRIRNDDTLWVIEIVDIYEVMERVEREYQPWKSSFDATPHPASLQGNPDPNFSGENVLNTQKELYNRIYQMKIEIDGARQMAANLKADIES